MLTLIQIIIIGLIWGKAGDLEANIITISQFFTYEIVLIVCLCILQLIKEAVSTRNTYSNNKILRRKRRNVSI